MLKTRNSFLLIALMISTLIFTQSMAVFNPTTSVATTAQPPVTTTAVAAVNPTTQHSKILELKTQLQNQKYKLEQVSDAIAAEPVTATVAATPSLASAQTQLGDIGQTLGQLQLATNQLEQATAVNIPAGPAITASSATIPFVAQPVATDTPVPTTLAATATPVATTSGKHIVESVTILNAGSPTVADLPTNIDAIVANANQLRQQADQLEQQLDQLEAASQNDAAPGYTALIVGDEAKALATQADAPHGWPVKGPVTSVLGLRPLLFGSSTTTTTTSSAGKGGNPLTAPATTQPAATPTPSGEDKLIGAGPHPTLSFALQATATPAPTVTATPVVTPTVSPTVTATTVTATTVIPTVTLAPTVSPTPTATIAASPTPTATATATPSNQDPGPGYDSTGIVVPAGMEFHTGIDIAVPEGTPVRATADGVVEYAGDGRGGYGNVVYIDHPGGFITIYGHNSRLLVRAGQSVKAGDIIALSGNTGYSTGPHVHYEIRYGTRLVDPAPFMPYNP